MLNAPFFAVPFHVPESGKATTGVCVAEGVMGATTGWRVGVDGFSDGRQAVSEEASRRPASTA